MMMMMSRQRGLNASPLPRLSSWGSSSSIVNTISTSSSTTVTSIHDQRRTTAIPETPSRPHTLGVSTVSEHPLMPMLREIRDMLQAYQLALKTERITMKTALEHIQAELAALQKTVKEESEKGFSIEASVFKNDLAEAVSGLFMTTLTRFPSKEAIACVIKNVLLAECECKSKFQKALTFCSQLLTTLRAEERRKILGRGGCESFPSFSTDVFVEKFLSVLKVGDKDAIALYKQHVSVLRSFIREDQTRGESNTYHNFSLWLKERYPPNGVPSLEEMEHIHQDDHFHLYEAQVYNRPQQHSTPFHEPEMTDFPQPVSTV